MSHPALLAWVSWWGCAVIAFTICAACAQMCVRAVREIGDQTTRNQGEIEELRLGAARQVLDLEGIRVELADLRAGIEPTRVIDTGRLAKTVIRERHPR